MIIKLLKISLVIFFAGNSALFGQDKSLPQKGSKAEKKASTESMQSADEYVVSFRINKSEELYISTGESEKKIAENVLNAWILISGKIVYSARDGAGGFENEGQSLQIYDSKLGKSRKILSEYYLIEEVIDQMSSDGRIALIVRMTDGNAGNNYISVVDPTRGEVFFRKFAEVLEVGFEQVVLGIFQEGDWDDDVENPTKKFQRQNNILLKYSNPKPYKTEKYDLVKILSNEIIVNKISRDDPRK